MSKYTALGSHLRDQPFDRVSMTFADIERVIGFKLPEKSQVHRAWWSNNPGNNVMTKIWMDAGFRTEQVDIKARRLVFRRVGWPHRDETSWPRPAPGEAVAPAVTYPMGTAASQWPATGFGDFNSNETEMLLPNTTIAPPQPPHPLFGALKGLLRVMPGTDLTKPADPKWGEEWGEERGEE